MSANINYTQQLKDNLYSCMKACQNAYDTCLKATSEGIALDLEKRTACVSAAQSALESCKQTVSSCSAYLHYTTETDSIALCNTVVEKCNICIKIARKIIDHCDVINKQCGDIIQADINTFQDCIDACRSCAEHPDL